MSRLFENILQIETALKSKNFNARLRWKDYYYEALKYAPTPADVQNMSFIDLVEFVGQKKRFYAEHEPDWKLATPRHRDRGGSKDAWIEWRLKLTEETGFSCTFKQLSKLSGWSEQTLKTASARWEAENGE